jgi:hypothetical protein
MLFLALLLTIATPSAIAEHPIEARADSFAYRTVFYRAAPGQLLELIELLRARVQTSRAVGEPEPLLARHSQGDHWDLLYLQPIGTVAAYHDPARQQRWAQAAVASGLSESDFARRAEPLVAWREELFVAGPDLAEFEARNNAAGFYHLEVFLALAGQREGLHRQRLMENEFLAAIGRPTNLVFTRLGGAAWDLFTLGYYQNLQDYATPAGVTPEQEEAAAVRAGFQSRNHIGSYLRTFLASHHDTLLGRVMVP